MKLKQYQVDAFAVQVFEGNPAAVCPLEHWPDDGLLQAIAEENNLSETAFFVPKVGGFELRWFTPVAEVDLCGHATLATAHVIFEKLGYSKPVVSFQTRSGELKVQRKENNLEMNFPASVPISSELPEALVQGLGVIPTEVLLADDLLAVVENEKVVREIEPDHSALSQLESRGVIVTAPGLNSDFVSRFFAPKLGVPEDPVTGSAHCVLTPYWAKRLGKNRLVAKQVSKRGGTLHCELQGNRVLLSGSAVTFMEAEIAIQT